jgi:hypothetical protein
VQREILLCLAGEVHARLGEKKGAGSFERRLFHFGVVPRSFWNVLPSDSAALARASIVDASFQWSANEVKK